MIHKGTASHGNVIHQGTASHRNKVDHNKDYDTIRGIMIQGYVALRWIYDTKI